jgi:hypothetical protein
MTKILIFTFNAAEVNFCKDPSICSKDCASVLFINNVLTSKQDIYVIGLQEAINDNLIQAFKSRIDEKYPHQYKIKINSIGGIIKNRHLYIATIYKNKYEDPISKIQRHALNGIGGKGAITMNFTKEKLFFIVTHLPFNGKSADQDFSKRNQRLKSIHERFKNEIEVSNTFLFGDLNYRVSNGKDELAGVAQGYKEGINGFEIDNQSEFLHTCKLSQAKNNVCKIQKNKREYATKIQGEARVPSWCDRILYRSFSINSNIKCLYYKTYDYGNIQQSDHKAVIGKYKVN